MLSIACIFLVNTSDRCVVNLATSLGETSYSLSEKMSGGDGGRAFIFFLGQQDEITFTAGMLS